MTFQMPELPANILAVTCGVVGFVAVITVLAKLSRGPNLDAFPAVGSSTWLGSWWAAFKYLTNAQSVIQEGYEKYKSAPFKVAGLDRWTVILSNRGHLEEVARASDDELSCIEAIDDQIQFRTMLGHTVFVNLYHASVVLSNLTRKFDILYPEIREEIVASFTEVLDLRGNEWQSLPALSSVEKVVCRTSNRLIVGLPLCRSPDWIDLNIRYVVHAMKGGVVIGLLPKFVRPLATRCLTNAPQCIMRGMKLLGPIIEERQRNLAEYGKEWDDKPNDLLSWLMDELEGSESTTENLTTRVLVVNFATIFASSNSFTWALFFLAANPQYIRPLREEVEGIVAKEGWSKSALSKMRKVDSFLKECQRVEGINLVTLTRKALKDFTFTDGTLIPKGAMIVAATHALHHDENVYEDPDSFKPFRFATEREEDGGGERHQFASTMTDYLSFGHGRQACPGRFFAASVLKSLLAHVVVTYDVKLEDNKPFPQGLHIGTLITANPRARVLFRNRLD